MLRTKRLCALALVMLLCFAAARSESLISSDSFLSEASFTTRTLEKSDYAKEVSCGGGLFYPRTVNAINEFPNAKYGECLVERGDMVEKGDALIRMEVNIDEVALLSAQYQLQNSLEDYEKGVEAREKFIEEFRKNMQSITDQDERRMATLQLQRMRLELESYSYRQEYSMERQQKSIDEMIETRDTNIIVAPASGKVSNIFFKREGDVSYEGEPLVTIEPTEDALIYVTNGNNAFKYNMPVKVEMGIAGNRETLTGRIVAADTVIPEIARTGYAFIRLDDYEGTLESAGLRVFANAMTLEDVLILHSEEQTKADGGGYYVKLLDDDMVKYRYINSVILQYPNVWVLQGLSEGDQIIQE